MDDWLGVKGGWGRMEEGALEYMGMVVGRYGRFLKLVCEGMVGGDEEGEGIFFFFLGEGGGGGSERS